MRDNHWFVNVCFDYFDGLHNQHQFVYLAGIFRKLIAKKSVLHQHFLMFLNVKVMFKFGMMCKNSHQVVEYNKYRPKWMENNGDNMFLELIAI